MYCNNCGEVLELGQAICSKCGTPVVGAPIEKKKDIKANEVKKEKKVKRRLKKTPIIILIIVAIIFFAVIIFWDKINYILKQEKNTNNQTTTVAVEKEKDSHEKPAYDSTKEFYNEIVIPINGGEHNVYVYYYRHACAAEEITEYYSMMFEREIYYDNKKIVDLEVNRYAIGTDNLDNYIEEEKSRINNYVIKDKENDNTYNVILYKSYVDKYSDEVKYNTNLLILDMDGNKILDKSVMVSNRGVFMQTSNRDELGDRTIKEIDGLFQAYNNDAFMNAPVDIVNDEVRILLFSDEENTKAIEYNESIKNGALEETVVNRYSSDNQSVIEYGKNGLVVE